MHEAEHRPDADGGAGRAVLTHASWFSGVGGLDIGLETAGWRTVSFSEIDPYASAVLAQRWPGVVNVGDIVRLDGRNADDGPPATDAASGFGARHSFATSDPDWTHATLWSGGFPCQDLSVAGKRKGLAGARSGLAFAFLDLVRQHRPPWFLLENVPGLLSSHGGRDLGVLLDTVGQLGYGWAFRVLDARHFGVPQRRRRVFILCHTVDGHPDADGPAEVLAVGTRCRRHPPTGIETGEEPAEGTGDGVDGPGCYNATAAFGAWDGPDDTAGTVSQRDYKSTNHIIVSEPVAERQPGDEQGDRHAGIRGPAVDGASSDAGRMREIDGLGGRSHDRGGVEEVNLPPKLDSHRYRCCGNGVVAPVAEWIGLRLRRYLESDL